MTNSPSLDAGNDIWPSLPLGEWSETHAHLHLITQIVGKIRLRQCDWVNHSWHCTLHVTARGLTTGPISHGTTVFEIELDLIDHVVGVTSSDGRSARIALRPRSIASFHAELLDVLESLDVPVTIHRVPNEIVDPIPFDEDVAERPYDGDAVNRYWRILVQVDRVLRTFRSRFTGKCSPVHYFWGAPDLAVTRFSGRPAPKHPGGVPHLPDWVVQEAYSEEVSSCGFWAGGGAVPYPAFYSYAYPEPPRYAEAPVEPAEAFYSADLREFVLPYDAVRTSGSPDETLMRFLQSTYEAAADLGTWDRDALERPIDPRDA
jgi:hypothetical protein